MMRKHSFFTYALSIHNNKKKVRGGIFGTAERYQNKRVVTKPFIGLVMCFMLLVTASCERRNVNEEMEIVEGLLVPTREEANEMIVPYSTVDGPPLMIQPLNYDLDLAIEKGIATSEGFSNMYLNMRALYRKVLEQYLSERLSLETFDEMLKNSDLGFISIATERMNFYQRHSTFGLQYIYLRSNLPIERLSIEDLDILMNSIEAGSSEVTEELLSLVSRTYRDIIIVHPHLELNIPIGFSNDGENIAPNNALVFEIGHTFEIDENGRFLDEGNERAKRESLTYEFIPLMEERLSEELGIPVVVFHERR